MEKKTKNRIMGCIILASVAVIAFPLFQSNDSPQPTTVVVQAPPFPEANILNPEPNTLPLATIKQNQENTHTVQPKEISPSTNISENHTELASNKETNIDRKVETKQAIEKKTIPQNIATKHTTNLDYLMKPHPVPQTNSKTIIDMKKPVWVVQIASYKEKNNAVHMVNTLRAHGFQAFIQHHKTKNAVYTRVYIGPEKSPENAKQLSQKLAQAMHMKGFIIPYQPLAI